MSGRDITCGVAGAGVFGGYHAAKVAGADGARLARVFDADAGRARARADEHGAEAHTDLPTFLDGLDAVVVATPASTHAEIARAALSAGCHVLVEKPIALTLGDADALIALAEANGLVLQVGHQERYVAEALGLLGRPGVRRVRSRRLTRPSGRAGDVSVVMDLMIHDLDLLAALAGTDEAEVTACAARGRPADAVTATVRVGGIVADLEASRVADRPVRELTLGTDAGEVRLDFLTREAAGGTGAPLPRMDEGPVLSDPLGHGTRLFLKAVRGGSRAGVTGQAGRAALRLALLIEEAARGAT